MCNPTTKPFFYKGLTNLRPEGKVYKYWNHNSTNLMKFFVVNGLDRDIV